MQDEIERAAFEWQQQVERGERVIVGVNAYAADAEQPIELQSIDPAAEQRQLERTAKVRAERNAGDATRALERVRDAARGTDNLLPPMRDALRARCTSARSAVSCARSGASTTALARRDTTVNLELVSK